jgi:hypothetical protein
LRKSRKTSVRIVGAAAEIRTVHPPNKSLQRYIWHNVFDTVDTETLNNLKNGV